MSQEFFDRGHFRALFQQIGGERMAQAVAAYFDARRLCVPFHLLLNSLGRKRAILSLLIPKEQPRYVFLGVKKNRTSRLENKSPVGMSYFYMYLGCTPLLLPPAAQRLVKLDQGEQFVPFGLSQAQFGG